MLTGGEFLLVNAYLEGHLQDTEKKAKTIQHCKQCLHLGEVYGDGFESVKWYLAQVYYYDNSGDVKLGGERYRELLGLLEATATGESFLEEEKYLAYLFLADTHYQHHTELAPGPEVLLSAARAYVEAAALAVAMEGARPDYCEELAEKMRGIAVGITSGEFGEVVAAEKTLAIRLCVQAAQLGDSRALGMLAGYLEEMPRSVSAEYKGPPLPDFDGIKEHPDWCTWLEKPVPLQRMSKKQMAFISAMSYVSEPVPAEMFEAMRSGLVAVKILSLTQGPCTLAINLAAHADYAESQIEWRQSLIDGGALVVTID